MPNPGPAFIPTPIQVEVQHSFEDACRKFKNLVQKEKIIGQYKERMFYEKPSVKKRRKKREAAEQKFLASLREKMIENGEWEKRKKRKDIRKAKKLERKIRRQEELE